MALRLGVDAEDVRHLRIVLDELVDADDDVLGDPVALVVAESGLLDLVLDEVDRVDRPAELVDLRDQLAGAGLDLVGQRLDEVRPRERVDGVRGPGLVADDLLRAQGDLRRALGWQRQRLVEAVGVQRLGAAAHGREALQGDPDDVVLRLLGGQRHATGLRVKAKTPRALILGAEALAHDRGPHPPRGAELRHLLEDIVVAIEEEGQPRPEPVDLEAGVERRLHVGDAVGERERDLLHGRAALLAKVVARDRDRVPLRDVLLAVREQVDG